MARLGDLMGTRATATLNFASTDPTGIVPACTIVTPIIGGDLDEEAEMVVDKNPATGDGAWPVTDAGVDLPVTALLGGQVGNRPVGTTYRVQVPGIEELATSATIVNGVDSEEPGAPKQIVSYKKMERADLEELFRAQVGRFPAVCLSWERTQPSDGPQATSPGPRASRQGRTRVLYRHVWVAFLVTSRMDGASLRQEESALLRDEVVGQLSGATKGVHGLRVSQEPGAEVVDVSAFRVSPTSYVDLVRFRTLYTQEMRRNGPNAYNPWTKTRLRQQTKPQPPDPPLDLPDGTIDMT